MDPKLVQKLTGLPFDVCVVIALMIPYANKSTYDKVKHGVYRPTIYRNPSKPLARILPNGHHHYLKISAFEYYVKRNNYEALKNLSTYCNNNTRAFSSYNSKEVLSLCSNKMFKHLCRYFGVRFLFWQALCEYIHGNLSKKRILYILRLSYQNKNLQIIPRDINEVVIFIKSPSPYYPRCRYIIDKCIKDRPMIKWRDIIKMIDKRENRGVIIREIERFALMSGEVRQFYTGVVDACLRRNNYIVLVAYVNQFNRKMLRKYIKENPKIKKKMTNITNHYLTKRYRDTRIVKLLDTLL